MGSYLSNTPEVQRRMLEESGFGSFDELFEAVPEAVRAGELRLPKGLSEMEALERVEELADRNRRFRRIFRGAGAYDHYIPAAVKSVTGKEEFVTAYTPYQAEISQGILQSIFEYQTMICELTGMDVSNASVYDGATAAAEAAAMCRERRRQTVLVSACADPKTRRVIETYCFGSGARVVTVPERDGATDTAALEALLDDTSACFYMQYPNYYGVIEDAANIAETVHRAGAKLIMGCYPIALAMLGTPGECGADIAVGEGQPLGLGLAFGGPYLGFMAAREKLVRKLPGRIVGETVDGQGRRAFVLTLQAREQHIRREKAGSNICSNEALCALTAAVYMSAMGAEGMRRAAELCVSKAHYLQKLLCEAGLKLKYERPFFNEFVTESDIPSEKILAALEEEGILGGLPLDDRHILWCATEKNGRADIERVALTVKGVR